MNIGSAFGFSSAFLESGTCNGDLDGNNVVDGADLSLILGSWGLCSGKCDADLDEDGTVGGADLALLLGAWGACDAEAQ